MNHHNYQLSNWTRQVAFQLTLNDNAIRAVIARHAWEQDVKNHGIEVLDVEAYADRYGSGRTISGYLMRRGLLMMDDQGQYRLTRAGQLTAELLIEAGFKAPTGTRKEEVMQG